MQEVAGVDRPIRNISKSPMFNIFFSLPRSQCSGDGCSSSELGWVAGVCLSSLVPHSSSFEEAPVILWGPADHHSAILAPEAVVSGSARSGGRRSGRSSTVQGSSASATLPSVPSGGVQAVASCVETYQAIHPCWWILQACSTAGFLSTPSILTCGLPIQVACL